MRALISPSTFQDPAGTGGVFLGGSDNGDDCNVMISPDGTYTIEKSVKGSDGTLARGRNRRRFQAGPGAVNEIKVVNRDDVTTFYLDGVKVQDVKGTAWKGSLPMPGPMRDRSTEQLDESALTPTS